MAKLVMEVLASPGPSAVDNEVRVHLSTKKPRSESGAVGAKKAPKERSAVPSIGSHVTPK
jgi:hypothetical protein